MKSEKFGCASLVAAMILIAAILYGMIWYVGYEERKDVPVEFREYEK